MPSSTSLCVDCQTFPSQVAIRKRRLCHDCFHKFVSSKVLKRMETYRFKNQVGNQKKRLLLPLSGGVSSLVLLQILDAQIKRQLSQQNRTAYDLVVCHVSPPDMNGTNSGGETTEWWKRVQEVFDLHTYPFVTALLDVTQHDHRIEDDLALLGVNRHEEEDNRAFVERVLTSARTATSRADLHSLLLRRLIVSIAKQQDCESIIWGHSDSQLAAQALASVAKGRGGATPNELADGPSPWGLNFNYPLRDLFRTELQLYLETLPSEFRGCLLEEKVEVETPVSLRATSIDALLSTYITGQGEKYPSIMANVVRTASKLQVPSAVDGQMCRLCAMPVVGGDEQKLCYGCERMKQDIKV
ncbi:Cytoplasmic tRNA 2-thiolation protein 2 [Neophaeococcomyces mojaviensis]|uniref:Cytoplasmic tRNA 2-thiolation protein 2 n=1 Tax=Neophaeococcomyces mojaviensis TaxID=3383035 RepID=A0ACC2ZWI2_9EURO|nr:Cytoplasmic tRNA 2-thiolation protein 2 [Knufia sp. JES_112]